MAEFSPKNQKFLDRLLHAQRAIKSATYRPDIRLAVREICEAVTELVGGLLDKEQEKQVAQAPECEAKPAKKDRPGPSPRLVLLPRWKKGTARIAKDLASLPVLRVSELPSVTLRPGRGQGRRPT